MMTKFPSLSKMLRKAAGAKPTGQSAQLRQRLLSDGPRVWHPATTTRGWVSNNELLEFPLTKKQKSRLVCVEDFSGFSRENQQTSSSCENGVMSQSTRPVSAKNAGELQQPQVGAGALGRGNNPSPPVRPFGWMVFFSNVTHSKLKFWQVCLQFCLFVATSCFNWVASAKVWSHKRALKELEPWYCWGLYPTKNREFAIPRNSYQTYIHNLCIIFIHFLLQYFLYFQSWRLQIISSYKNHVEFSNGKKHNNWTKVIQLVKKGKLRSCQAPGRETPPHQEKKFPGTGATAYSGTLNPGSFSLEVGMSDADAWESEMNHILWILNQCATRKEILNWRIRR